MPITTRATCGRCGAQSIGADGYCGECGRLQPRVRDHLELDVGGAAGVSDRGLRHHRNEDALALRRLHVAQDGIAAAVAVVCDGVSASPHADEASAAAAEAGADTMVAALRAGDGPEAATHHAVEAALAAVVSLTNERVRSAPACTYTSAVVTDTSITVASVGDSRAYWVPEDGKEATGPTRLTEDDSWAAEHFDPTLETWGEHWSAHAITAWLGADADEVEPHIVTFEPAGPGIVVVCTDGLWNYLDSAEDLAAHLPGHAAAAPDEAARELLRVALEAGGRDNVTVAIVPFFAN